MDPLLASAFYNFNYSLVLDLPEELLLKILRCLFRERSGRDPSSVIAFFCLRQVCRRFRRIIDDWEFRLHPFSTYNRCQHCRTSISSTMAHLGNPAFGRHCFEQSVNLQRAQGLVECLQRDHLCKNCQVGAQRRRIAGHSTVCKFAARNDQDWLHCSDCNADHPSSLFSPYERQRPRMRQCIAREGRVRLCQHMTISWEDIESTLAGGIEDERIVNVKGCNHATHSRGCFIPSLGPLAYLLISPGGTVSLGIQWSVHSGPMLGGDVACGAYSAKEMRAVVRELRRDTGRFIVPEQARGHLPEMEAFGNDCDCLTFHKPQKPQEPQASVTTPATRLRLEGHEQLRQGGEHWVFAHGAKAGKVGMRKCPSQMSKAQRGKLPCVIFEYRRSFTVMHAIGGEPDHAWYHALDRDSYDWDGEVGAIETCDDPACRNSYMLTAETRHHRERVTRACEHGGDLEEREAWWTEEAGGIWSTGG